TAASAAEPIASADFLTSTPSESLVPNSVLLAVPDTHTGRADYIHRENVLKTTVAAQRPGEHENRDPEGFTHAGRVFELDGIGQLKSRVTGDSDSVSRRDRFHRAGLQELVNFGAP